MTGVARVPANWRYCAADRSPPGYMCGTWIALQDISADSGESVYYPGSHRAPRVYLHNLDVGKTLVAEDYVPFEAKVLPNVARDRRALPARGVSTQKGDDGDLAWESVAWRLRAEGRDSGATSVVIDSYAEGSLAFADAGGITYSEHFTLTHSASRAAS